MVMGLNAKYLLLKLLPLIQNKHEWLLKGLNEACFILSTPTHPTLTHNENVGESQLVIWTAGRSTED